MYKLSVKGKYIYNYDKPFFLLGDTAWLLLYNLDMKEIERYLRNRSELGYNYIQVVLKYHAKNSDINDMATLKLTEEEIFDKAIKVLELAKKYNLIIGYLPCWGSLVKQGDINKDNAKEYALFLANKFKGFDNLIWILGGDVRGDVSFETFDTLGTTLKENSDNLITFHPFGRTGSYLWFNDSPWLSFNCFQSGHRRYDQLNLGAWDDKSTNEDSFGEDSYKYVIKNNSYEIKKPVLDAEPSYEGIVQGLHDPKEPYWEAMHVRRYAYWSVFEGACGFVYGNNAIIQFYREGLKKSYGVRETWEEGLSSPGGSEMQYLKDLMNSFDFSKGASHPEYVLNNNKMEHRQQVFAGKDFMLIYTYMGDKLKIDMKSYKDKKMDVYFMNPENNSQSYYDTISGLDIYEIRPTRKRELNNDWVIIFEECKNA